MTSHALAELIYLTDKFYFIIRCIDRYRIEQNNGFNKSTLLSLRYFSLVSQISVNASRIEWRDG